MTVNWTKWSSKGKTKNIKENIRTSLQVILENNNHNTYQIMVCNWILNNLM